MNSSASPGFEDFSDFENLFENEVLRVDDFPDPLKTRSEERDRQLELLDAQCLDQDLTPQAQSIDIAQNHVADPVLHKIQPNPQFQTEWHLGLQSKLESKQAELQEFCAAQGITLIPDSQYEDMVMEAHRSMEKSPPSQLVPNFSSPSALFQRFELDNDHTEDMEVDEIRPNIPLEKPKQQKPRPRKVPQSTDQNTESRKVIVKKRSKNSNGTFTVGSSSDVNSSNPLRMAYSGAQRKCPSCNRRFADSREVRRHFRMIHAGTDTQGNICLECLQKCPSATKFRRHWDVAHVGELRYVCQMCGARFGKQRNLSWHMTKLHSEKPTPNENHQDPQPQDS